MAERISGKDILSFNHYKKGRPFTGSCEGMRFRIIREKAENEDDTDRFRVDTWPEPLCFEATEDGKILTQRFVFSDEGYEDVIRYLNDMIDDYKI